MFAWFKKKRINRDLIRSNYKFSNCSEQNYLYEYGFNSIKDVESPLNLSLFYNYLIEIKKTVIMNGSIESIIIESDIKHYFPKVNSVIRYDNGNITKFIMNDVFIHVDMNDELITLDGIIEITKDNNTVIFYNKKSKNKYKTRLSTNKYGSGDYDWYEDTPMLYVYLSGDYVDFSEEVGSMENLENLVGNFIEDSDIQSNKEPLSTENLVDIEYVSNSINNLEKPSDFVDNTSHTFTEDSDTSY